MPRGLWPTVLNRIFLCLVSPSRGSAWLGPARPGRPRGLWPTVLNRILICVFRRAAVVQGTARPGQARRAKGLMANSFKPDFSLSRLAKPWPGGARPGRARRAKGLMANSFKQNFDLSCRAMARRGEAWLGEDAGYEGCFDVTKTGGRT